MAEPTTWQQAEDTRRPASRTAQHQAAARTNVRRHNGPNVCSLLHTSCIVPLYAEDAVRRLDTIRRRPPPVVPTAGGAEAGNRRRLHSRAATDKASVRGSGRAMAAECCPNFIAAPHRKGAVCTTAGQAKQNGATGMTRLPRVETARIKRRRRFRRVPPAGGSRNRRHPR